MKNDLNSFEDIKVIRKMMEESTRFLSLSGLSGVFAGVVSIIGAYLVYLFILDNGAIEFSTYLSGLTDPNYPVSGWLLIVDALTVLGLAITFALVFSLRKARRDKKKFMTPISLRMLLNLSIPLFTGGVFVIALVLADQLLFIVPCFLIFYGLALVNAGKFTFSEIFYLGLLEIIIGLVALFVPEWGLIFWLAGFGVLHIIYGAAMYRRYER
jgi:hypothetical protein